METKEKKGILTIVGAVVFTCNALLMVWGFFTSLEYGFSFFNIVNYSALCAGYIMIAITLCKNQRNNLHILGWSLLMLAEIIQCINVLAVYGESGLSWYGICYCVFPLASLLLMLFISCVVMTDRLLQQREVVTKIWFVPGVCESILFVLIMINGVQFRTLIDFAYVIGIFVAAKWMVAPQQQIERERKRKTIREESIRGMGDVIFDVKGVRGRYLKVYDNKCVITTKAGIGSFITGNLTDGEKTIYYRDCLGVQFKQSGVTIGYLQLETASSTMNNRSSNFFNENSFTFDVTTVSNEQMEEVAKYVKEKVEEVKTQLNQPIVAGVSSADELKKYKDLLDMGVISQEEFDAKKKQLLGL